MYFARTSSVTFPVVATKYPRAHRCRPQNSFRIIRNSCISRFDVLPLINCITRLGQVRRPAQHQVHLLGPNMPLQDFYPPCRTDLSNHVS
jgi:hypothetical protein